MRVHIAPLILPFSILAPAARTQDAVPRTYDLEDLARPLLGPLGRFDRPMLPLPVGPVLPVGDSGRLRPGGACALEPVATPRIVPSAFADWLQGLLGAEGSRARLVGDHELVLEASAGAQARVKDVVTVFALVMQRTYALTVYELPAGAGVGPLLTPEQTDALLRTTPPVRATTADIEADVPWLCENGRTVRYVKDYEVEVAEKSNVADPKLDGFFAGTRVSLCATPLADGRVLLRAGLHTASQVGPLRERQLSARGLGKLHLPVVDTVELRISGAVPAGGGLLLAGERDRASWLLRLRPHAAPPPRTSAAAAVALGHLAVAPMQRARMPAVVVLPGMDFSPESVPEGASPDLLAAVDRLLSGQASLDPRHAFPFGSHLVLVDEPGVLTRLEAAVQQEVSGLHTTSIAFRVGRIGNDLAVRHASGAARADELAAALPPGGCLTTLPEHAFAVSVLREQAFVRDYEVEIAGKAHAANPVVDTAFGGFSLCGRLRTGADGPRLSLQLGWSEVPTFAPVDLGNADLGEVDAPVTAWTEAATELRVKVGEWQVAHLAPDPQDPSAGSLVLLVRTH